ncbi:hypothetical protein BgiBS90_023101, partial [Biomphalaria glabrata]
FYLRAVLFGKGEWRINLKESENNIPFHFRRRSDRTCPSPCHTVNTATNDNWMSEINIQDFPYIMGQSFELHILFRSRLAYIYFNRRLTYTYNNSGGPVMERGRYLTLVGEFFAEELAI